MQISLPQRITNISLSAAVPADQLMTLGRIYSTVGDYASSLSSVGQQRFGRECLRHLRKIVAELIHRRAIVGERELYLVPTAAETAQSLDGLTIDELECLFRAWPARRQARRQEGREALTFYFERQIVAQLQNRKAADLSEQLKIDYCLASYRIELHNLGRLLGLAATEQKEENGNRVGDLSVEELTALIQSLSAPADLAERERLVEGVDRALTLLNAAADKQPLANLAAELLALRTRKIIDIPAWVDTYLKDTLAQWHKCPTVAPAEMAVPLLAAAILDNKKSRIAEARKILNDCYRAALTPEIDCLTAIDDLYHATRCHEYVARFSPSRVAARWEQICNTLPSDITPQKASRLLSIATALQPYAPFSPSHLSGLTAFLQASNQAQCF